MNLGGCLSLFAIGFVLVGAAAAFENEYQSEYHRKTAWVLFLLGIVHALPLVVYAWVVTFDDDRRLVTDVRCEVEK